MLVPLLSLSLARAAESANPPIGVSLAGTQFGVNLKGELKQRTTSHTFPVFSSFCRQIQLSPTNLEVTRRSLELENGARKQSGYSRWEGVNLVSSARNKEPATKKRCTGGQPQTITKV